MKRKMERSSGLTPHDLRGTSPVQGVTNGPVSSGNGRLPYEASVIEVTEVVLECSIAAGSARLKNQTGNFTIEDYAHNSITDDVTISDNEFEIL